jgi:hypothetical protein
MAPFLSRLARGTASVGLELSIERKAHPFSLANDPERRPMKNPTDRAVEAIEAAKKMFADETGATLGLSPAAKLALIVSISAEIQAAVEERQQQSWVL